MIKYRYLTEMEKIVVPVLLSKMNSSVPNLKESNWKTLMPLIKEIQYQYGVKIKSISNENLVQQH
jgi:hypothetical protein